MQSEPKFEINEKCPSHQKPIMAISLNRETSLESKLLCAVCYSTQEDGNLITLQEVNNSISQLWQIQQLHQTFNESQKNINHLLQNIGSKLYEIQAHLHSIKQVEEQLKQFEYKLNKDQVLSLTNNFIEWKKDQKTNESKIKEFQTFRRIVATVDSANSQIKSIGKSMRDMLDLINQPKFQKINLVDQAPRFNCPKDIDHQITGINLMSNPPRFVCQQCESNQDLRLKQADKLLEEICERESEFQKQRKILANATNPLTNPEALSDFAPLLKVFKENLQNKDGSWRWISDSPNNIFTSGKLFTKENDLIYKNLGLNYALLDFKSSKIDDLVDNEHFIIYYQKVNNEEDLNCVQTIYFSDHEQLGPTIFELILVKSPRNFDCLINLKTALYDKIANRPQALIPFETIRDSILIINPISRFQSYSLHYQQIRQMHQVQHKLHLYKLQSLEQIVNLILYFATHDLIVSDLKLDYFIVSNEENAELSVNLKFIALQKLAEWPRNDDNSINEYSRNIGCFSYFVLFGVEYKGQIESQERQFKKWFPTIFNPLSQFFREWNPKFDFSVLLIYFLRAIEKGIELKKNEIQQI